MATVPPTVEEGPEYEQKLIGDLESDYSKGLSGTKTDTIIENAYGTLMRGAEGIEGSNPFPVQGCVCEMVEGEHGVGCPGKWLRTLNKQGTCYMYIHTITHVITAKRPEGMPDPAEDERKRREAAELAKFPVCLLDDVEAFARTLAEEEGVVPLFLADAPGVYDAALANFKAIKCRHIDTRPFAHGAQRTGVKFADHVELLKQKLIGALLNGTLACLDLQDDLCEVRLLLEPPVSSVDMRELVMAIDAAVARGKTPVLIDRSADGRVDTFLSYQRCQVVDVAQTLTSARTDEEKSEVLRAALVRCMKAGDTLLLKLRDTAPPLLAAASDHGFPMAAFDPTAVSRPGFLEGIFREKEKESGVCVCREGFRVVATSRRAGPGELVRAGTLPGRHIEAVEVDSGGA